MTIETIELSAPSHWAPALIYADISGLEDQDIQQIKEFIGRVMGMGAHGIPVDCTTAPDFMHWHDARPEYPFAADCFVYTFQKVA